MWRSELLLAIFAAHLKRVKNAKSSYSFPSAALGLSASAVCCLYHYPTSTLMCLPELERALFLFRTGYNIKDLKDAKPSDNEAADTYSFDGIWADKAADYAESAREISPEGWQKILQATKPFVKEGKHKRPTTTAQNSGRRRRAMLKMSDAEDSGEDIDVEDASSSIDVARMEE